MKEEIVSRVLEDSESEPSDSGYGKLSYAGLTIIGFGLLAYAVLAVFVPSAVAVFGLPTLETGTGGIWGAASYWWLIALGASGILAVITGIGGYVLEITEKSDD